MSVINDMLNDLEQRTHPQGQTAGTDAEALHAVSPVVTRTHSYWWLAGLGAFSAIAWFGWSVFWQGRTQSNQVQLPMQSPASISASVAPTAASQPLIVDPVSVVEPEPGQASILPPASNPILERIGLTDQGGLSGLELEFNQSLPAPPLQYRRGDRLWLRLFSADVSRVELPELTNDILINEWDAYIEDGYQVITLRVAQSTEVELIQVNPRRWRLNLHQQAAAREEPSPVASDALPADLPLSAAEVEKNSQIDAQVDSPEAQQEVLPVVKKSKTGYQAAEQALAAGHRVDAEIKLKEVLVKQPGHLQASLLLGRLYLQNGQPELAEPTVMAALQRYPKQTQLISYFTRSLLGQSRLTEAAQYLSQTMQIGYAEHLGLMAFIRQRQGHHQDASQYYQQALRQKPNQITWLTGLAISQEHLGELIAARQAYRRSMASGKLDSRLQGFVEDRLQQLEHYE